MLTRSDMAPFLIAHAGMRVEYGRLAEVARTPRDSAHEALIDDQISLVLFVLRHHHDGEDDTFWPLLRERVPAARPELARLEDEHHAIDPVIEAASDVSTTLWRRADALERLHGMVNAHLDEEERVAVPLLAEYMTRDEWEASSKRALGEMGRRRMPTAFGWMASSADEELRALALAGVPALPRILFRTFWWPAYQKRFAALYGHRPQVPVLPSALRGPGVR